MFHARKIEISQDEKNCKKIKILTVWFEKSKFDSDQMIILLYDRS